MREKSFIIGFSLLVIYVTGQKNWRKVYLDDPKGIITGYRRRLVDYQVEFADLGSEYEQGTVVPKPMQEDRSDDEFFKLSPNKFTFLPNISGNAILSNALCRYKELTFPDKDLKHSSSNDEEITALRMLIFDGEEPLSIDSDESYTLNIDAPNATLEARSIWGALRGLETFSQTVYRNGSSYRVAKNYIKDRPRFKHRGFLMDTGRHFIPTPKIFQFLDALTYSKFNVLHWHIVDDNSFPYVSEKFPQLSEKGAFLPSLTYKPQDVQDVIEYAKLRGIRVMPEFDTPGHVHSWNGIPGLLTECTNTNQQEEYFQDMKGPINPIKNGTYEFLEKFFEEVDEVFPDDYIHLGGDEVDFECWESNPEIQEWLRNSKISDGIKNGTTLHTYYMRQLTKIIEKLADKKYVVWQDVVDDGVKIEKDAIVNVWKEGWEAKMRQVTEAGHKAILSSCWYLNYIQYGLDWPKFYHCDPQEFGGTEEQKKLVMGGSAAIWGEYVDATNLIQRTFGRGFAVAERLWSPKEVKQVKPALKRFWEHQCRYILRGIPAEPVVRSKYCRVEWGMPLKMGND